MPIHPDREYMMMTQDTYFPTGNKVERGERTKQLAKEDAGASLLGVEERRPDVAMERQYFPDGGQLAGLMTDGDSAVYMGGRGKYYIELAIFVDRDLHRHMMENFPEDTEGHVVQVVLAMINAVSRMDKEGGGGERERNSFILSQLAREKSAKAV